MSGATAPGWITAILTGIQAPISSNTIGALAAWNACEGNASGGSGLPINNPFNTTVNLGGAPSVNSAGVKHYPSMDVGVQATVQTIMQSNMSPILQALRNNANQQQLGQALNSAPWGTNGDCVAGTHVGKIPGGDANLTSTDTGQQVSTVSDNNPCLLKLPSTPNSVGPIPLPSIGGGCLFQESWGRAFIGGALIFTGGIVVLGGLIALIGAEAVNNLMGGQGKQVTSAAPVKTAASWGAAAKLKPFTNADWISSAAASKG